MLELSFAPPDLPDSTDVFCRVAARGIVRRDGRCLLVRNIRGEYKFPGGGAEPGETPEAALAREVREETGYRVSGEARLFAVTHERRRGVRESIFEMDSYYYFCQVEKNPFPQRLDAYEAAEGYCPVWLDLAEALAANRSLTDAPAFLEREIAVMEALVSAGEAPSGAGPSYC